MVGVLEKSFDAIDRWETNATEVDKRTAITRDLFRKLAIDLLLGEHFAPISLEFNRFCFCVLRAGSAESLNPRCFLILFWESDQSCSILLICAILPRLSFEFLVRAWSCSLVKYSLAISIVFLQKVSESTSSIVSPVMSRCCPKCRKLRLTCRVERQ